MNQSNPQHSKHINTPKRFAFIQSGWHRDIIDQARISFLAEMTRHGVGETDVEIFDVPGAFEIPLHAKKLAQSGRYAAIVACGFVVDGGIYRHDFVASAVINALMTIQIDAEVPILSVVLTPQHFHSHEDHRKFFTEHFVIKGVEAAQACLGVVKGMRELQERLQAA